MMVVVVCGQQQTLTAAFIKIKSVAANFLITLPGRRRRRRSAGRKI